MKRHSWDDPDDEDAARALRHGHHKSRSIPIHPGFSLDWDDMDDEEDGMNEAAEFGDDWAD